MSSALITTCNATWWFSTCTNDPILTISTPPDFTVSLFSTCTASGHAVNGLENSYIWNFCVLTDSSIQWSDFFSFHVFINGKAEAIIAVHEPSQSSYVSLHLPNLLIWHFLPDFGHMQVSFPVFLSRFLPVLNFCCRQSLANGPFLMRLKDFLDPLALVISPC